MAAGRSKSSSRPYDRTERVGELIREILAEELRNVDDDRLRSTTVTAATVDPEIRRAQVFVDNGDPEGTPDDEVLDALGELRIGLQAQINQQTRLRRTPELVFNIDEGVRSGARIEQILSELRTEEDEDRTDTVEDADTVDES